MDSDTDRNKASTPDLPIAVPAFFLQAGLGDCRSLVQRLNAPFNQLFVVELNTIRGLVLDAIPQGLEVTGLSSTDFLTGNRLAVVSILDLQLAGKLLPALPRSEEAVPQPTRQLPAPRLQGRFQGVLNLALVTDIAHSLEVAP